MNSKLYRQWKIYLLHLWPAKSFLWLSWLAPTISFECSSSTRQENSGAMTTGGNKATDTLRSQITRSYTNTSLSTVVKTHARTHTGISNSMVPPRQRWMCNEWAKIFSNILWTLSFHGGPGETRQWHSLHSQPTLLWTESMGSEMASICLGPILQQDVDSMGGGRVDIMAKWKTETAL